MNDKICLVTGANSGLGFAMASGLAKTGATVVMLCRDPKRGRKARIRLIAESQNPNIDLMIGDLSLQADVRRVAADFLAQYPRLDVLANMAGIVYPYRKETPEGFELNFATDVLGPFLLTNLLLERMIDSAPARIINVSGEGHRSGEIRFEDLQLKNRFSITKAGTQAALARVVLTYELARKLRSTGVTVNTFCPGWTRSSLLRYFPAFLRWPVQIISRLLAKPATRSMEPIISLAIDPYFETLSGKYLSRGKIVPSAPVTYERQIASNLWRICEKLTGSEGMTDKVVKKAVELMPSQESRD